MTDPIIVRQSTYNAYALCPARIKYRDHGGYNGVPSEAMSWGTLMHKLIELKIANPNDMVLSNTSQIITLWNQLILEDTDDAYGLDDLATEETRVSAVIEAIDALGVWESAIWRPYYASAEILGTEVALEQQIGEVNPSFGIPIILQGTVDLIMPNHIVDWKTATTGWRPGKAEANIQAASYAYLASMAGYEMNLPIQVTYVVYSRKDGRWDRHDVFVDRQTIQGTLETMRELGHAIYHRTFVATPQANSGRLGRNWHCSAKYCGAWDVCVEKAIVPDGADLTERSAIVWR